MKLNSPTTLVIFGATGDLAKRKLFSALFSLFKQKMLSEKFRIVGFARSSLSDREFQRVILTSIKEAGAGIFAEKALYQAGLFEDISAYKGLGEKLLAIDREINICTNKLFYLAVPPKYYKTIFENLAASGLSIPCGKNEGWTRVLVEKPFGQDRQAAQELDELLTRLFREEQIFRIDHYLARETMQNILTFRFSNEIFEPIWNNRYVEYGEIRLLERKGVGERGMLYDEIGALRDVGQNHLLQMLALVAMDNPQRFKTDFIRQERAKVLEALHEMKEEEVIISASRGQHEGFRSIQGVRDNSQTETYFRIKAFIHNERWRGVPFYLEAGKGMKENVVEINIYFKSVTPCFCPVPHETHQHQNKFSFTVRPKEGISIRFWVKKPGLTNDIEPKELAFSYGANASRGYAEAYEKVLFDSIYGEQMLFASNREVAAAWRFIMPILQAWEKNRVPLKIYKKGGVINL